MRLIDADALIQKRNHAKNYSPEMYVIGQGYVMDAPTIDAAPVARGEWEPGNPICPVCGENKYKGLDADIWSNWTPAYCPNCGAKMEERER